MNDPKQWEIAAALAAKCGLDWGRWALGLTAHEGKCGHCIHKAHSGMCSGRNGGTAYPCPCFHGCTTGPVAEPWDAEAYKADCARRGVEPGPLPSLRYRGNGVRWRVLWLAPKRVAIEVGDAMVEVWSPTRVIATGMCTLDDLARAVELARVAKEAMR